MYPQHSKLATTLYDYWCSSLLYERLRQRDAARRRLDKLSEVGNFCVSRKIICHCTPIQVFANCAIAPLMKPRLPPHIRKAIALSSRLISF
ncbi:hypothetical protein [Nostoc sp.]|uniref:hypothetical protein n=1 Tax=Nostoc sp. TaxID=1180 RepID=UPI002FF898C7